MKQKINKCPKTLSGKHCFEEEKELHIKTIYCTDRYPEYIGTGKYICKYCGIYDDTRNE